MKAALKQGPGVWVGWSGNATHTTIAPKPLVHDEITYITLDLSKEDHQEYYNGFTNRVLWPILHYRVDLAEFSRRDLSGYLRVNDYFARALDEVLEPDDLVWVHDYHLMPLGKALRERGHKNRIGFFLHIPCPPPEIFSPPYLITSSLFRRFTNTISSASKQAMMPLISAGISHENAGYTAMTLISSSPIGQCGSMYFRSV